MLQISLKFCLSSGPDIALERMESQSGEINIIFIVDGPPLRSLLCLRLVLLGDHRVGHGNELSRLDAFDTNKIDPICRVYETNVGRSLRCLSQLLRKCCACIWELRAGSALRSVWLLHSLPDVGMKPIDLVSSEEAMTGHQDLDMDVA